MWEASTERYIAEVSLLFLAVRHFKQLLTELQQEKTRRPRISGALLPPTLFNPPLHRYKPVQPDAITMMIFRRRKIRLRRRQHLDNYSEMIASVKSEADMMKRLSVPANDNHEEVKGWVEPLQDAKDEIYKSFGRDHARSKMVFTEKMLLEAKAARRAKQRSRLRLAHQREMEKERRRQPVVL